jgi:hypothetical protein
MSSSIRFLGLAVLAWAGVRAASLGLVPGLATGLAPSAEAATNRLPPVEETHFTPPPPPLAAPVAMGNGPYGTYPAYPGHPPYGAYPQPVAVPYYYPVPARMRSGAYLQSRPSAWDQIAPTPRPLYDGWAVAEPMPMTQIASTAAGARSSPAAPGAIPGPAGTPPPLQRLDRLQLTAWALLRGSWGPGALAPGGTLGGSQAGARLTYNFSRSLAASLRSSSSIGGVRYAEVAAGVRWQPLASVPVALNFERRQALNNWGGRSAFALFAEGGLYQRPLFGIGNLDLYAQGGVVGFKSRDYFFDGGTTITRPLWRNFSAGLGVWGGMQPGLYRVDAGPRLTMAVGHGIRLHADYRQRLAGEAMPASGPALTIASDW